MDIKSEIINFQDLEKNGITNKVRTLLSSYPKFKSVAMMAISGLPVPESFIIASESLEAKEICNQILSDWHVKEVVVRSDTAGGSMQSRSVQGCQISDVWNEAVKFLKQGLLPMVISTGDIFHNIYSLNLILKPENKNEFYVEIVGPGFCATDLNKRDIVNESGLLTNIRILVNSKIVNQEVYNSQVDLMKESLIEKEIEKGREFESKKEARIWLEQYLKRIDALILRHNKYKPISKDYLRIVWDYIPKIIKAGELMGYSEKEYIVSMSFVNEDTTENLYFWDIHPYNGYRSN